MSQLFDWRRKTLKKSQEALALELGYGENWTTYAAQERGENPLPPEIKEVLRKKPYKYAGLFPDEEATPLTRDDLKALESKMDDLLKKNEAILAVLKAMEK